ncbi:JmjC domain-containing protein [Streptomyces luteireticuli]|uniref:JmjC domain-containing protein n=1 Tax=Streptomyces luteireticuli TaxID=173858 RepID=A0ABN0YTK1_9ACTN
MALQRCTALSPEEFRSSVLGRSHLHTRAAELKEGFADLFSPEALEELISSGLRTSSLRLVRDGVERAVDKGCVPEPGDTPGAAPFPSTDGLRAGLAAGQTLIVRSLHRYHAPIRRFAHELAAELGQPVKVNAFVTPPGSQGVDLHFDVQDVIVLQIHGDKRWVLRRQPIRDPLPAHAWFDIPDRRREELRSASEPLDDLVLEAGDTLYLPRGTLHSPMAREVLSIHLTLAITRTTHHDLLTELVRQAVDDDWLRAAVDPDALDADPGPARSILVEAAGRLAAVAAEVPVGDLLWAVRKATFREQTPEPVPVLPASGDGPAAGGHRLRDGAHFHTAPAHDGLMLSVGSRRAQLPAVVEPFLRALRRDPVLDTDRLAAVLGEDGARAVAKALVDMGLLLPPAGPPGRA